MKKYLILLSFVWASLSFTTYAAENPYSVVIIGGGPAGLATAIEAKLHGAEVTIIEKNLEYFT